MSQIICLSLWIYMTYSGSYSTWTAFVATYSIFSVKLVRFTVLINFL